MSYAPTPPPGPHAALPSALTPGTRLGEFELLRVLGVGGFGIVYLALDHDLEREVAVKEYMPASLAGRTETQHVSLRSQSDADTFALGLRSFVNEARLLARFDHPSLLKVHRFWEANGTAYMAMPVLRGRTVKDVRQTMAAPPDEAWLRALLDPLLGAIERLHSEGVYHRDIAPDNIQIEPDGRPVLLDFGAARRVIGDKSQTLTAILKPAYAPIEQYAEAGSVKQGPWTDIYALGATLHYLLLLKPPPPATARAVHDDAAPLAGMQLPGCSQNFLQIVDWMLAPRPTDRPQSVAALRDALDGRTLPPRRRPVAAQPVSQWEQTVVLEPAATQSPSTAPDESATRVVPRSRPPAAVPSASNPAAASADRAAATASPARSQPAPAAAPLPPLWDPSPAAAARPGRSRLVPVLLGLAAVGVAAAVALWPRPAAQTVASDLAASAPLQVAPAPTAEPPAATMLATPTAAPEAVPAAPASTPPVVAAPPAVVAPHLAAPDVTATASPAPAPTPTTTATLQATPLRTAPSQASPRPAAKVSAATAARPAPPPEAQRIDTASQRRDPSPRAVAEVPPAPAPQVAAPVAEATPRPEAAAAVKPVATGPESKCDGRNPLSYFACMERECWRSENESHPDCVAWHKGARRR
jgi:serine/threonine protein kinase